MLNLSKTRKRIKFLYPSLSPSPLFQFNIPHMGKTAIHVIVAA